MSHALRNWISLQPSLGSVCLTLVYPSIVSTTIQLVKCKCIMENNLLLILYTWRNIAWRCLCTKWWIKLFPRMSWPTKDSDSRALQEYGTYYYTSVRKHIKIFWILNICLMFDYTKVWWWGESLLIQAEIRLCYHDYVICVEICCLRWPFMHACMHNSKLCECLSTWASIGI